MSSRDTILNAVAINQPSIVPLPDMDFFDADTNNVVETFVSTLTKIGGSVVVVQNISDIENFIGQHYDSTSRKVSTMPGLGSVTESVIPGNIDPHTFSDVELAVIEAHFGVAENGAVWVTSSLTYRVLPFICQHLAIVLNANNIVPNMHRVYEKIGAENYGFGTFIAGPSKTADIEQSLVLGAHGSRSTTIFLLDANIAK